MATMIKKCSLLFFKYAPDHFRKTPLGDFIILALLSTCTVFFVAVTWDGPLGWLTTFRGALDVFLLTVAFFFFFWFCLLLTSQETATALRNARISLAPALLLLLVFPYVLFPVSPQGVPSFGVLAAIFCGMLIVNFTLRKDDLGQPSPTSLVKAIWIVSGLYALCLGVISVCRYLNFQNTSPFDVALYNQIQWNNIHGRFFQSSISGSNFVTHNSPFLILLSPFYAIYPHPATLYLLKTLFLAFSAIPFYLILQKIVTRRAIFPLLLAYLFHPFIVSQNFNAPHEMCFSPPFLLFSFYFFLTRRFGNFLIFLLLSLSVKEHVSLLAMMYGLYALYLRREKKWVVVPIGLGLAWAVFSLAIIYYFQTLYSVDPYPAWLIDNIKRRFVSGEMNAWESLRFGLQTSNLGSGSKFIYTYMLFSPLLMIFPLFSPVMLLGMPELFINLLASLPLMYPIWHYNIMSSSFMILSCVMVLPRLSVSGLLQRGGIRAEKIQELLAIFLLIAVASHAFLWWPYLALERHPEYVRTMNEALRLIPPEASVSASKNLLAYVCNRRDYFMLEDRRRGEYIAMDHGEKIPDDLKDCYAEIFYKDGVRLYKRK